MDFLSLNDVTSGGRNVTESTALGMTETWDIPTPDLKNGLFCSFVCCPSVAGIEKVYLDPDLE
jgi:hypothetical protein